jgi:hypothetical protein
MITVVTQFNGYNDYSCNSLTIPASVATSVTNRFLCCPTAGTIPFSTNTLPQVPIACVLL